MDSLEDVSPFAIFTAAEPLQESKVRIRGLAGSGRRYKEMKRVKVLDLSTHALIKIGWGKKTLKVSLVGMAQKTLGPRKMVTDEA